MRFGEVLDVDDGANDACLGLRGKDMSEVGEGGDGLKLEFSGEVGVVDAVRLVNPVDAELIESLSVSVLRALLRYESLGSLVGST